jgi:hypothetical protein
MHQVILFNILLDFHDFIEHSFFVDLIAPCALELRLPEPQLSSIQRVDY